MQDDDKRAAALSAVNEVQDGMLVGLGTGSTAHFAIEALGRLVGGGLRIAAVATSDASAALARRLGIDVRNFAGVSRVDLTIDGTDEIDPRFFAIKGGGGAMVREKIVAAASARMIVVADGTKQVGAIGAAALPVEVLPFALGYVTERLHALGVRPALRGGGEPYRTDNGNLILDCAPGAMPDPRATAAALDAIPGVVGHGLFLDEVDALYLASGGVVTRLERHGRPG